MAFVSAVTAQQDWDTVTQPNGPHQVGLLIGHSRPCETNQLLKLASRRARVNSLLRPSNALAQTARHPADQQ